jgi:hypothetical protein
MLSREHCRFWLPRLRPVRAGREPDRSAVVIRTVGDGQPRDTAVFWLPIGPVGLPAAVASAGCGRSAAAFGVGWLRANGLLPLASADAGRSGLMPGGRDCLLLWRRLAPL